MTRDESIHKYAVALAKLVDARIKEGIRFLNIHTDEERDKFFGSYLRALSPVDKLMKEVNQ